VYFSSSVDLLKTLSSEINFATRNFITLKGITMMALASKLTRMGVAHSLYLPT